MCGIANESTSALKQLQTVMWDKCFLWFNMVYVTLELAEEQESEYGTSSGLTMATEVQKQGGTQWMLFT